MANQTHYVDLLATGTATVTVNDDGSGTDWLSIVGLYMKPTEINLNWTYSGSADGMPTSASGLYYTSGATPLTFVGHRLVVNGAIEHAQGSNGSDSIQGNSLDNALYGDAAQTGAGGSDTLFGSDGNDTLLGGSGNDSLDGAEDNDFVLGNAGNDTMNGGSGNDILEGGEGADSMSGGADGRDEVSYHDSTAGVKIRITHGVTTTGIGGFAQGDRLNGFNDASGSAHADVITDTVVGNIAFGYNANSFYGEDGNDRLNLGGGDDNGYGGDDSDILNGGAGKDELFGGRGHDVLTGGTGRDTLWGDQDADVFVFSKLDHSGKTSLTRDTIADFRHAQGDEIDLSGIDAKTGNASSADAFRFIGASAFSRKAGELQVVDTGPNLLVRGDVNGDGQADFSILVASINKLVAGDFLL